jgi:transcriptional regulator with XRE-family HTH domain
MTAGRRRRVDEIPADQSAVIGANIRTLRQRQGWSQAKLGELMGWPTNSTVCAAEGRRNGRQRGFSTDEVGRLAAIFNVPIWQLTTWCANCDGHPPTGFSCLTCGARR